MRHPRPNVPPRKGEARSLEEGGAPRLAQPAWQGQGGGCPCWASPPPDAKEHSDTGQTRRRGLLRLATEHRGAEVGSLGAGSICPKDTQLSKETDSAPGPLSGHSVDTDLLPVELRLQIIQRERSRKELFRRKNEAAAVVQWSWRSYRLRKRLAHRLHIKQLGTRDMDRWNRECVALILQGWRKELELKPPKTMAVKAGPPRVHPRAAQAPRPPGTRRSSKSTVLKKETCVGPQDLQKPILCWVSTQ